MIAKYPDGGRLMSSPLLRSPLGSGLFGGIISTTLTGVSEVDGTPAQCERFGAIGQAMHAIESAPVELGTVVEMIEVSGEWFVRVVEKDCETVTTYPLMARAMAYAERQRKRLGLKKLDIL